MASSTFLRNNLAIQLCNHIHTVNGFLRKLLQWLQVRCFLGIDVTISMAQKQNHCMYSKAGIYCLLQYKSSVVCEQWCIFALIVIS